MDWNQFLGRSPASFESLPELQAAAVAGCARLRTQDGLVYFGTSEKPALPDGTLTPMEKFIAASNKRWGIGQAKAKEEKAAAAAGATEADWHANWRNW